MAVPSRPSREPADVHDDFVEEAQNSSPKLRVPRTRLTRALIASLICIYPGWLALARCSNCDSASLAHCLTSQPSSPKSLSPCAATYRGGASAGCRIRLSEILAVRIRELQFGQCLAEVRLLGSLRSPELCVTVKPSDMKVFFAFNGYPSKDLNDDCCSVNVAFNLPPSKHGPPLSSHKEHKSFSAASYCKSSFRKLKSLARCASKKNVHNNPVYPAVDRTVRSTCSTNTCSSPARYLHSSLVVPSAEEQCDQTNYLDQPPTTGEHRFRIRIKGIIRTEEPAKFGKHSALAKARTLSIETKKAVCERLIATWPQSTTVISSIDDFLPAKEDYEKCYNPARVQDFNRELNVDEAIKEWSIPYKDLSFKEALRTGQSGTIYKGHWHGDVLIYTFENCQDENKVNDFWETIAQLCMIRHENIVLFMGACVEIPHLSVITSMRKGPTLFEHLHVKHQIISPPNRINIARQIAQAMGYLHARGIIHKRLSSNNIILESKVKICLMDQGSATYGYNGTDYGLITRGHLTYLSPQLMRCLDIEPPYVRYESRHTPESDVYAFGTIMFELMTGKFPYQRLHTHAVIWLIGNGQHESVIHIKGSNVMRSLVASCWSPLSGQRPPFSHIVKQLQENISLYKEHSCSEPERLNKIGFC